MLATLCLILAQPQTVDFELRASRLPVLVEALGQKLNEKLFCSPDLGRHVVLVRFAGVSPREAKVKIAEAVDAEWVDRNGTLTLWRSPGKQRELNAKWQAAQEKSMAEALEAASDMFSKTPAFDTEAARKLLADLNAHDKRTETDEHGFVSNWQQRSRDNSRGPGGRAILALLNQIGAKDLATLPVGRTVFATNPTRLQRPLPRTIEGVLKTWDQEQQIWMQALDANPPIRPQEGVMGTDPRFEKLGEIRPAKVLLIASRYGLRSNINFSLTGYDAVGTAQFSTTISLTPKAGFDVEDIQKANLAGAANGDYELSEESKEKLDLSRLDYASDARPSQALAKEIADPVTRDPLSYEHSEILLEIAKRRKLNLVASLNDMITLPSTDGGVPKAISLEGYLKYNETMGYVQIDRDETWLAIRPASKYSPPTLPEDRFAARKLIQSALQHGYFTLDALGEYALAANDDWNSLSFNLARILLPRTERILQDIDIVAYQFYGSLSPSQRKSLLDRQPISLATLSNSAKEKLMKVASSGALRSFESGLFVKGQNTSMMRHTNLSSEPTEMLANGLFGDVIQPTASSKDDLMVGTRGGKYVAWTRFGSPESLGQQLTQGSDAFSRDDDFWIGSTFKLSLSVRLNAETEIRMIYTEYQYDARKPPFKLDGLPDSVKQRMKGG